MRIFFKVILFPISLVLTVFVAISSFLIERCAILLNIIAGLGFLAGLVNFAQYFWGFPFGTAGTPYHLKSGIFLMIFAFILSPYGLPTLAMWIVEKLGNLSDAIKSI
ncbi:CD1845 family protein [Ruminococcaceae bacterium OttesenSCG-928-L11]|nr:CD1845 family protein [Ruminococcaceae bacterium OttesenSCG-928-L11]